MPDKSFLRVSAEAVAVGILLILFAWISIAILHATGIGTVETPSQCDRWNDKYIMEISLFLSGFMFHMFFQYAGLNKMYVDDYVKNFS